jgi:two-component system, cell cycle response regulator DivK
VRDVRQVKGYRVAEAETGEDGIIGITAFRQIRDNPATATIPVIAVTASAMTQDRKTIMAAGFDGFQGKPISVKELLETVRQILERS